MNDNVGVQMQFIKWMWWTTFDPRIPDPISKYSMACVQYFNFGICMAMACRRYKSAVSSVKLFWK